MHERAPSLENLIESEDLGLETFHPGGLQLTEELAELCDIRRGAKVLDVASGTGHSARYLTQRFDCQVVGLDSSNQMVTRAKQKALGSGEDLHFLRGDAHHLPFNSNVFDIVLSECAVCLLNTEMALAEMARVTKPGGRVGIHEVCWKPGAPKDLREELAHIEGERPETLEGWKGLFEKAGLVDLTGIDKSYLLKAWTKQIKTELGISGQLRTSLKVIRIWGIRALGTIWRSERIFRSEHIGYGIVVGRKL